MKTYLICLVSISLYLSTVYSAKCKKFVCKSFQAGPADTCVYVDTAEGKDQLVRSCDTNKTCSAVGWFSVDTAIANATCMTGTAVVNATVPGDMCSAKSECFSVADGEVDCASGICTTTRAAGAICLASNWCGVGFICDVPTKKCVAQKVKNDPCTTFEQCPTNLACLKNVTGGAAAFTCQNFWTYENGIQFDGSLMRQNGVFFTMYDACKSGHMITPDNTKPNIHECRMAHVSNNLKNQGSLERPNGPATDCSYTTHDTVGAPTTATNATDTAKCGFNKGGSAYCGKRKGDEWFQAALTQVQGKDLSTLKCHANTGITTCASAGTVIGKDIAKKFAREWLSTTESQVGWAIYANNDNCVAQSMTAEFWQGDKPSFAFGGLTMSSFAAIVLTISALFYMF